MATIFVFGSNLVGRHGAGSAQAALQNWGAVYGKGQGPQGHSYAIPTKDRYLRTLPLKEIKVYVDLFLDYARCCPEDTFNVVAIGCGLAGYTPEDIAPMFRAAPKNCVLPRAFISMLECYQPRPEADGKISVDKNSESSEN